MKLYCLPPAVLIILFCSFVHIGTKQIVKRNEMKKPIIIERIDRC